MEGRLTLSEAQRIDEVLTLLEEKCSESAAHVTVAVVMRRENVEEFTEICRRVLG